MAQLAEINAERSMIEFAQAKALKLFSEAEIKEVIRKREEFEYLISKQQKLLRDYLEYIKYETSLMRLVSSRQTATGSELRLELSIAQKIRKLYSLATTRFPHEVRLWEQFIVFCTHNDGDPTEIRSIFATLQSFHSDKEECWLKNIRWERRQNVDGSRDQEIRVLIAQAMRHHPRSIVIAIEMLQVLLGTDRIAEKRRVEQAQVAYKVGAQNIGTLEFQLAALEVVLKHEFAAVLRQLILDDMRDQHADKPMFWETIAQLELKGVVPYEGPAAAKQAVAGEAADAEKETSPATTPARATTLRSRIEACVRVYDAAVRKLPVEAMWTLYIDAMLLLNRDQHVSLVPLRRRMLERAFKEALSRGGFLSVTHFTSYVQLLYRVEASDDLVEEIIQRAVDKHSRSVPVWQMYMKHYWRDGKSNDRARLVFRQACVQLKGDAAPLWEDYIIALKCNPFDTAELQRVYEELMLQTAPQFDKLKADYLWWIYMRGEELGIERTRQAFRRLASTTTLNYEMVAKLVDLEAQQLEPNLDEWENALQTAVTLFGKQRMDVWMQLMQFQSRHGDPLEVSRTSERAKQVLSEEQYREFLSERQLWLINAMARGEEVNV